MRSTTDDLTTRARIRDAAIECFGERGFAGASLREIARVANVSPALIVHHFGGKDGLREACDDFVVTSFLGEKDAIAGAGASAAAMMRAAMDEHGTRSPRLEYMARMLVEDSTVADHLFQAFLTGTRQMIEDQIEAGVMRPQTDLEATAIYLTLYGLGPIVLHHQIARAFGESRLTTPVLERSTIPVLEMFTHGLYTDDRMLVAAREALARRDGPPSGKGENDPNQDPDPPH
ncbi:MAG: TetR family transcriptional regulator [Actinomycetota bacterium]